MVGFLALASAAPAGADFTLSIIHTNDLHSRLQPVNAFNGACDVEGDRTGSCFGGIARVKAKIDERRRAVESTGGHVLVLDAGDQFQGSLFYTTYRGKAAAEFMNGIGFDAMAVGNHEFDDGPGTLAHFIGIASFDVISANIDASASPALHGRIRPYTVARRGGESIGIVGATTEDTREISSPGPDIAFEIAEIAIARAVAELETQGVSKIILLSHLGLARDREVARHVDGLDVIVGGHSHSLLSNREAGAVGPYPVIEQSAGGYPVPIVQAYAYSRYVGELEVIFDDDGVVLSASGEPHRLDAAVVPDPAYAARVEALAKPFEALLKRVVGRVATPIDASRCRKGECEMGNLVADAMLERVKGQGVTIAIQNGGGLRASFDAGDVTMGEVLTVLPFGNTVSTFQLSGADIVSALENGVGRVGEGAGRFPQVAGLRYAFSAGAPRGARIVSVETRGEDGWRPLERQRMYSVVSNDYLRRGGDGYTVFRDRARNAYDFGPGIEETVVGYLDAHPDYRARIDGRIRRLPSTPGA